MGTARSLLRGLLRRVGYSVIPRSSPLIATDDLESEFLELYETTREFTMTSLPRMYALYQAVRYVEARPVPGAFVECGVWRGGSAMLMALTQKRLGSSAREIVLYDTFEGMPEPGAQDVDYDGRPASATWWRLWRGTRSDWCYASLDEVRANLAKTGYPPDKVRLVKGLVEETIPANAPAQIAILRLDTDWYDSTYHELVHLFPRLAPNGVLIVDDYGYWKGARAAVDEYFGRSGDRLLLSRLDSSARIGIKTG